MYFPTYHQTNFFKEPQKVVDWSKTLEFYKSSGEYPGYRTKPLHEINYSFFRSFNLKILRLIYGDEVLNPNLSFQSTSYFQKIKNEDSIYSNEGWIHTDGSNLLTCIIYLSPNLNDSGTSLYEANDIGYLLDDCAEEKFKFYKGQKIDKKKYLKALNDNNNKFTKTVEFKSNYNTFIAFDSSNYHAATLNIKPGEERLTLITFFSKITASHYPASNYDRNP